MAFDTATRNELQKVVSRARDLLVEEFMSQCQGIYGIQPDGSALDLSALAHLSAEEQTKAELLRNRVEHLAAVIAGSKKRAEAVSRLVREQSFTVLNRLCALRMCEERGLVQECVRNGYDSKGFKLFDQTAAKLGGDTFQRYGLFVQLLFDELAVDLGVLFDRFSLYGLLFPRESALKDLLAMVNTSALTHIWAEDEAIGWVYQYFNSKEEREAMRKASASPRNSRELAVRNQFFTPRYVVEFLTDNTLGRIWYEMRKGETTIKDSCRYLVCRPSEVFLGSDEAMPKAGDVEPGLTEQERLKLPVYVDHREKKDPRDLNILDPACGSGHFLLYTFDLLAIIYREAWGDPESPTSEVTGAPLREDYASLADLEAAVPELILRWNLFGIDIDPRAAQIAALSLWLRAQKAWQDQGIKTKDRPRVRKTNIVCAEPMPGEKEVLRDFASGLKPTVLGQLVEVVFDKMQLAGEAGSLLRIEMEIQSAVEEARKQWQAGPMPEQAELFPDLAQPKQGEMRFDFTGVTRDTFWTQAEERILKNLQAYSGEVEGANDLGRRLFAEDAAQGFAFIDLCQKQFDVVVMNPPFGEFSKSYKLLARSDYPHSYNDILGAFIERFLGLLRGNGMIGAITSRTCFYLSSFKNWRSKVILPKSRLTTVADLGQGVMDDAMVEAAAYVVAKTRMRSETAFLRAISDTDRKATLEECIDAINVGNRNPHVFFTPQEGFERLPDSPFVYWIDEATIDHFSRFTTFEKVADVKVGLQTGDDPRFVRAIWEVPPENTIFCYYPSDASGFCRFDDPIVQAYFERRTAGKAVWANHVKAGASQPWFSPITLKVNWAAKGAQLRNFRNEAGKLRSRPQNLAYFYRPGFSWTRRAVRFYPYIIPSGCIPSVSRYMAFPNQGYEVDAVAVAASRISSAFLRFFAEFWQRPNFLVENLKMLPWPELSEATRKRLAVVVPEEVQRRREAYQNHEPFQEFLVPQWIADLSGGDALAFDKRSLLDDVTEKDVREAYGFGADQAAAIERDLLEAIGFQEGTKDTGGGSDEKAEKESADFALEMSKRAQAEALISYSVGCVFGRWDIRLAVDPALRPILPGPFDPMPVCPAGSLVGPDGLPARPGAIVSEEWLRARPDAGTLPPAKAVASATVASADFPLRVRWQGIAAHDAGLHSEHDQDNLIRGLRDVFRLVWRGEDAAIEQDLCRALGVKELRGYLSRPSGFFGDHHKRYSKSARKAPIYWPLSTESGGYTLWIYYPRLTDQTLYTCVNEHIDPKLQEIERDLSRLLGPAQADTKTQKQVDALVELQRELQSMREELLRVAKLPYKPDQNDGVLITAAPLWRLFRHKPWQKELKKCWLFGISGGTQYQRNHNVTYTISKFFV